MRTALAEDFAHQPPVPDRKVVALPKRVRPGDHCSDCDARLTDQNRAPGFGLLCVGCEGGMR